MVVAIPVIGTVEPMPVAPAGFIPSEKPVPAGAVVVAVTAPRGLSMKPRVLPAVEVAAGAAEVGAAPKNPVIAAVAGAAVDAGTAKREEPNEAWVAGAVAVGAGVAEGLTPKANPPTWIVVGTAVEATEFRVRLVGWVPRERLAGVLFPNEKPPPTVTVGAGAVVAWTLAAPKLNPPPIIWVASAGVPKESPPAAAGWVWG